jgi:hypothetical protein
MKNKPHTKSLLYLHVIFFPLPISSRIGTPSHTQKVHQHFHGRCTFLILYSEAHIELLNRELALHDHLIVEKAWHLKQEHVIKHQSTTQVQGKAHIFHAKMKKIHVH